MSWESTIPQPGTGDGNFEVPPQGNHVAVLVGLIDLGSHEQRFQGQSTGYQRRVALVWELIGKKKKDATPFVVCRDFTLSFHEKAALRQWLEKWRCAKYKPGEKINLSGALGRACLLTISHSQSADGQKTYSKVESIGALPEGMQAGKPTNAPVCWQIGQKTPEGNHVPPPEHEWLPYLWGKALGDHIRNSTEFNGQPVLKPPPRAKKPEGGNGSGGDGYPGVPTPQEEPDEEPIPF